MSFEQEVLKIEFLRILFRLTASFALSGCDLRVLLAQALLKMNVLTLATIFVELRLHSRGRVHFRNSLTESDLGAKNSIRNVKKRTELN